MQTVRRYIKVSAVFWRYLASWEVYLGGLPRGRKAVGCV